MSIDGKVLGRYYVENRVDVQFSEIPPYLIHALLATEDTRFFEHKGIDIRALFMCRRFDWNCVYIRVALRPSKSTGEALFILCGGIMRFDPKLSI
jgi:hypothetical protein